MGLLGSSRANDDPLWLQIAVHELGHALVWKDAGLRVKVVVFAGEDSYCNVEWDPKNLLGYAVGCWGGLEAEARWFRNHRGSPRRGNSGHDIRNFHHVTKGLDQSLSEGKARSIARKAVARQWRRIEVAAPRLVASGRLSGSQL